MREYLSLEENRLKKIVCNCCGRTLKMENGILKEECISADHVFGYFSKRDGVRHRFDLCEDCYQKLIDGFFVPVEEEEEKELL